MPLRAIHVYVVATALLASGVLVLADWGALVNLPPSAVLGLLALIALGVFSEGSAFSSNIGVSGGRSSLVFLPLVAAILLFGPVPAVFFIVVTATSAEFVIRRKPLLRALFNTSQYVVATWAAGALFGATGGYPLAVAGSELDGFNPQVGPVLAFGVTALLINHVAVAVAIALSQKDQVWTVLRKAAYRVGGTVLNDLMVLPVAILVAFLYFELHVIGLFVSLLPLLFIRYSYLAKFRLEAANRDLLRVLVKAIETRDPRGEVGRTSAGLSASTSTSPRPVHRPRRCSRTESDVRSTQ